MNDKAPFLRNYTSNVPTYQTIGRIEAVLIRCGVNSIHKEYGPQGEVAALNFSIAVPPSPLVEFRLPANKDAVADALWERYCRTVKRRAKKKSEFTQQAERTAWKLMQDWIEVQLSLIAMRQAEFHQVFLPYIWNAREGKTLYQAFKENNFKALPAPNES